MLDLEKAPPSTAAVGETVSSTTPVDLAIEDAVKAPVPKFWFKVAMITGSVSLPFYYGLCSKYLRDKPWFTLLLLNSVSLVYFFFLVYLTLREPPPYVLRRYEKLWIESSFVVVSSCWTLFERDGDIWTAILGLVLLFKAIPVMNLWWDFENFDSLDCYLAVFFDAALVCCRFFSGVALIVVAGVGVALHFIKDAYRHRKEIEINETQMQHLILWIERAYLWAVPRYLTFGSAAWGYWYLGGVDEQGLTQILF